MAKSLLRTIPKHEVLDVSIGVRLSGRQFRLLKAEARRSCRSPQSVLRYLLDTHLQPKRPRP